MTDFRLLAVPRDGEPITLAEDGSRIVPDRPILPLIPGDGVGPEVTAAVVPVLDAAVERAYGGARRLVWMEVPCGEAAIRLWKEPLPEEAVRAIRTFRVALKGPLTTPVGGGYRSLNVTLRQVLDLYACVRPVRWFPGVPSPVRDPGAMDVVIFRENTEDVYAGIEWPSGSEEAARLIRFLAEEMGKRIPPDAGVGVKPISPAATRRLVRAAIRYALENGRRSVTLVHKGNIMKYTEGAFRNWGYQTAREEFGDRTVTEEEAAALPGGAPPEGKIVIKDRIADSMFQQILTRTAEYDVIAAPNLNGDYLSDACAAQVGGLGLAPGANIGDEAAVFEATHGSAPRHAGLDRVNPGSLLLSGAMLLRHIGWTEAADRIEAALGATIAAGTVTYDLARQMEGARAVSTSAFGRAVAERL
ncbi:MAG: isocitrate dehydrogenase (NADP(+)) [Candidatus Eisenbacteria bacterium]|nr:isocitrate dehydrogenase (NADP(+)) [Candidatus Eisenbacteria bacterium]